MQMERQEGSWTVSRKEKQSMERIKAPSAVVDELDGTKRKRNSGTIQASMAQEFTQQKPKTLLAGNGCIGPDLLPMTFRDMVLNDLTDQLSIPLVKFVNSDPTSADRIWELSKRLGRSPTPQELADLFIDAPFDFGSLPRTEIKDQLDVRKSKNSSNTADSTTVDAFKRQQVKQLFTSVCSISFSGSQSRRNQLAFPPTQLIDIYGLEEMTELATVVLKGLREDVSNRRVAHLGDVQAFVRQELIAAVELMYSGGMDAWWDREASGERFLVNLIRMRSVEQVNEYRDQFIASIPDSGTSKVTRALAWCVFVDSVLLNERLNEDIRETTGTRPSKFQLPCWVPFYGPNPSSEAREYFSQYVQLRWPLRGFALDPQVDQQSIADASSVYRQMQMAAVLGFSSGELGLSTALDTIRKLQRDRATIDLNRTAVAFAQGDDTFGWRFAPRFQTPPVEGNAKVFFRDLIVGGPTDRQLERSMEIEQGVRECTAIVLMPSFVPYVTFETHGHWYKLSKPGHTGSSTQENVHLSRAAKQMRDSADSAIRCAHLYRDGEVERVLARVDQLEKRLPLQTIACQVPIENTHGGFELFSNGTRQLAPELTGWYGAPGYDAKNGSHFFITGDNFSIKQTHLIAGNQVIPTGDVTLISRQAIQVKLPAKLTCMKDTRLIQHNNEKILLDERFEGYVDVQVATPYGVSAHMLLPVLKAADAPNPAPAPGTAAAPTKNYSTLDTQIEGAFLRNKTGVLDHIDFKQWMLPEIRVPTNVPACGVPRNVYLFFRRGKDQLGPVLFKDVQLSRNNTGYQVSANSFLSESGEKGQVAKTLREYTQKAFDEAIASAAAAAAASGKPATPPKKVVIRFEGEYSIEVEKSIYPVDGQFPIEIEVSQP